MNNEKKMNKIDNDNESAHALLFIFANFIPYSELVLGVIVVVIYFIGCCCC